jgi:hypothetical protein
MPTGMGCSMDALPGRYMPAVDPPWLPVLQALREQHPAAHPYTLSLLLEVETGVRITGQATARWLSTLNKP